MAVGTKGKMLALEITPRLVRAVEYLPGSRPPAIVRAAAAERPGGEPVQVGRFLREFLAQNGFAAKRATVAYLGPLIEHRVFAIPPVAADTRDELVRGKIAEEVSTPIGELRVCAEVLGKTVEQGLERQEVLAVYTPDFEIRRLVFLLVEAGLVPVRVTSIPLSLSALEEEAPSGSVLGLLHVDPARCVLAVAAEGKIRFAREFAIDFTAPAGQEEARVPEYKLLDLGEGGTGRGGPSVEEQVAERVVTELTRSLLYFRQLSRGGFVSRLYRTGMAFPRAVEELVASRLKLEIVPHPGAAALGAQEAIPGDPAEFGVPLGLCAAGEAPGRVNLLPMEYLLMRRRRADAVAVAAVAAVFLAANAALYVGLAGAERRYREVLEGISSAAARAAAMQAGLARAVEVRRAVAEADAGEKNLASPYQSWTPLFASLGAAAPGGVSFTSLTVDRAGRGYRAELRGVALGKDPREAQGRVAAFLSAVRRHGVIADARYAPVEVHPRGGRERLGYEEEFAVTFFLGGPGKEDAEKSR